MDKHLIRALLQQSPQSGRSCLDDNELALFIDGKVESEQREEVIEHLAICEECYQLYAEVMKTREDLRRVRVRYWQRALKTAVPLALAAGMTLIFFSPSPEKQAPPVAIVDSGSPAQQELQEKVRVVPPKLSKPKSYGSPSLSLRGEVASDSEISRYPTFQLGILLVNLQSAFESKDIELQQMLMDDICSYSTALTVPECRELQSELKKRDSASRLELFASNFSGLQEYTLYKFGVWTEQVRQDISEGRSAGLTPEVLDEWRHQIEVYDLPTGISKSLETIQSQISDR
ncbi:MAG: hypothetical protein C0622_06565, partial [Desulfuromonas sp.]